MTTKEKAHIIANNIYMPYTWEDIMYRLEDNIDLPVDVFCRDPMFDRHPPFCKHKAKWIITCSKSTHIGEEQVATIRCTRHKNEYIKMLEEDKRVYNIKIEKIELN